MICSRLEAGSRSSYQHIPVPHPLTHPPTLTFCFPCAQAMMQSVVPVANAILLLALVTGIYATLGVNFFGGKVCASEEHSRAEAGEGTAMVCNNDEINPYFSKFSTSLLSMFQVCTGDAWVSCVCVCVVLLLSIARCVSLYPPSPSPLCYSPSLSRCPWFSVVPSFLVLFPRTMLLAQPLPQFQALCRQRREVERRRREVGRQRRYVERHVLLCMRTCILISFLLAHLFVSMFSNPLLAPSLSFPIPSSLPVSFSANASFCPACLSPIQYLEMDRRARSCGPHGRMAP